MLVLEDGVPRFSVAKRAVRHHLACDLADPLNPKPVVGALELFFSQPSLQFLSSFINGFDSLLCTEWKCIVFR